MSNFLKKIQLPERWKKYQVKKLVGDGAYGCVYEAYDEQNERAVVMKFGNEKDMEKDYEYLKNEVRYLRHLNHRNIVRLIDFSIHSNRENQPFQHSALVLEYCVSDLLSLMVFNPLSIREIKTIAKQILLSLEYLEDRGIVHCDVKPNNILLSSDGLLKLCDFGFARCKGYCKEGAGFNICYSPPESILQIHTLKYTIDAWSAGCIIAELYKGTFLFPTFISDALARDLISRLLVTDRRHRSTSKQILEMPYICSLPYPLLNLKSLVEVEVIRREGHF